MTLTKFVRNVEDLSDDGGFKFRFKCDRCGDGYESTYIAAKTNMLKTAMDVFQVFSPFGGRGGGVVNDIDRGLRGKEHDAAFERAVAEEMAFFKKCTKCGKWVCPENCWNQAKGICDDCAPEAAQENATASCPACGAKAHGGKFCDSCGASLQAKKSCPSCKTAQEPTAKFCTECGMKL